MSQPKYIDKPATPGPREADQPAGPAPSERAVKEAFYALYGRHGGVPTDARDGPELCAVQNALAAAYAVDFPAERALPSEEALAWLDEQIRLEEADYLDAHAGNDGSPDMAEVEQLHIKHLRWMRELRAAAERVDARLAPAELSDDECLAIWHAVRGSHGACVHNPNAPSYIRDVLAFERAARPAPEEGT